MKPSKIMLRIAVAALPVIALLVSSGSPAVAEATWSSWNNGPSLYPQQSFNGLRIGCPRNFPYLIGVAAQGTSDPQAVRRDPTTNEVVGTDTKSRVDSVTMANYPGYVTIGYSNSSTYQDTPQVRVGMKVSIQCSDVDPGHLPREINVTTIGRTVKASQTWWKSETKVVTSCPAGTRRSGSVVANYNHDWVDMVFMSVHMTDTEVWALYRMAAGDVPQSEIKQTTACVLND